MTDKIRLPRHHQAETDLYQDGTKRNQILAERKAFKHKAAEGLPQRVVHKAANFLRTRTKQDKMREFIEFVANPGTGTNVAAAVKQLPEGWSRHTAAAGGKAVTLELQTTPDGQIVDVRVPPPNPHRLGPDEGLSLEAWQKQANKTLPPLSDHPKSRVSLWAYDSNMNNALRDKAQTKAAAGLGDDAAPTGTMKSKLVEKALDELAPTHGHQGAAHRGLQSGLLQSLRSHDPGFWTEGTSSQDVAFTSAAVMPVVARRYAKEDASRNALPPTVATVFSKTAVHISQSAVGVHSEVLFKPASQFRTELEAHDPKNKLHRVLHTEVARGFPVAQPSVAHLDLASAKVNAMARASVIESLSTAGEAQDLPQAGQLAMLRTNLATALSALDPQEVAQRLSAPALHGGNPPPAHLRRALHALSSDTLNRTHQAVREHFAISIWKEGKVDAALTQVLKDPLAKLGAGPEGSARGRPPSHWHVKTKPAHLLAKPDAQALVDAALAKVTNAGPQLILRNQLNAELQHLMRHGAHGEVLDLHRLVPTLRHFIEQAPLEHRESLSPALAQLEASVLAVTASELPAGTAERVMAALAHLKLRPRTDTQRAFAALEKALRPHDGPAAVEMLMEAIQHDLPSLNLAAINAKLSALAVGTKLQLIDRQLERLPLQERMIELDHLKNVAKGFPPQHPHRELVDAIIGRQDAGVATATKEYETLLQKELEKIDNFDETQNAEAGPSKLSATDASALLKRWGGDQDSD
ncbi:hypothetical protein HLB44_34950 [Aquincola sp. S2]|uniref:Type III effector protein n=1 Tax=Pseudaquabacterium terrae TaxID=2732868 RepID=A0ABX2EU64_9BURK|nr:hypothetical protein [Aquabacterium terrae]NRF72196.1 hypothetical protein [Aquabacterium terrae]